MNLDDVRIFLAVAECGSLSAAARSIGESPLAVSRKLAALEDKLAARLISRNTRASALTSEGRKFLPYAQAMIKTQTEALESLAEDVEQIAGPLRITAPTLFGHMHILPVLVDLMRDNPGLCADIEFDDAIKDIVTQSFDVAIRIATLRDSELVSRKLSANPMSLYASPAYLAANGTPRKLADLKGHSCLQLRAHVNWIFLQDDIQVSHKPIGRIVAGDVESVRMACMSGLGIAYLALSDMEAVQASGGVREIRLVDAKGLDLFVSALMPSRSFVPARVRIFIEALEARLRDREQRHG